MLVYIDPLFDTRGWPDKWPYPEACHMMADSDEELHALAAKIGLRRAWHQPRPPHTISHYDLNKSRRAAAVRAGAIEVDRGFRPEREQRVTRPPYTGPTKIISGGQTGADIGGLIAAARVGIATGGYVPKGCKTEAGPNYNLVTVYGCIENTNDQYLPRTIKNLMLADATLIYHLGPETFDQGTKRTYDLCQDRKKPVLAVDANDPPGRVAAHVWLRVIRPGILNIAGPRESKAPGMEAVTVHLLTHVLEELRAGR